VILISPELFIYNRKLFISINFEHRRLKLLEDTMAYQKLIIQRRQISERLDEKLSSRNTLKEFQVLRLRFKFLHLVSLKKREIVVCRRRCLCVCKYVFM
jgi:hypothetical protein